MTQVRTAARRGEHGHYLVVYTNHAILDALTSWHRQHGATPTKLDWEHDRPIGAADHRTIRKRFGSWNAALMAAGLEPNVVGRKKQS